MQKQGYWTDRFFCLGNWCQPVPAGGFAYYLAARLSALRQRVECGRKRLCNVVEELCIAAYMPRPQVMVLQRADAAAGWDEADALVAVTQGELDYLKRE